MHPFGCHVLPRTMKILTPIFVLLCFLISSCTIPKGARILKRTTKEWRESPIVMHAWADTPMSGNFLTLRHNGKFEHTSSGLLKTFRAGKWTNSQDTIKLEYVDENQNTVRSQKVIVHRQTSTLIFEGDRTPVQMRLKIITDEIK